MPPPRSKISPSTKHPDKDISDSTSCPAKSKASQQAVPCDLDTLRVKVVPIMNQKPTGAGSRGDAQVRTFTIRKAAFDKPPAGTLNSGATIGMLASRRADDAHATVEVVINTAGTCGTVPHPFSTLTAYELEDSYKVSKTKLVFPVWVKPKFYHTPKKIDALQANKDDPFSTKLGLKVLEAFVLKVRRYADALCEAVDVIWDSFSDRARVYTVSASSCGVRTDGKRPVNALSCNIKVKPLDQFSMTVDVTEGLSISSSSGQKKFDKTTYFRDGKGQLVSADKSGEVGGLAKGLLEGAADKAKAEQKKKDDEKLFGKDDRIDPEEDVPVKVTFTKNGLGDPVTTEFVKIVCSVLNLARKAPTLLSRLLDIKVQVGWGGSLKIEIMKISLSADWGWQEHTDERVFLARKFTLSGTIVSAEGSITFGLGASAAGLTVEAVAYVKLSGEVGITASIEKKSPDPEPEEGSDRKHFPSTGKIVISGGARAVVGNPGWIKAEISISSGLGAQGVFHDDDEYGFYFDYAVWFKGIWMDAEAYCFSLKAPRVNHVLVPDMCDTPFAQGRLPSDSYLPSKPRAELQAIDKAIAATMMSDAESRLKSELADTEAVIEKYKAKLAALYPLDTSTELKLKRARLKTQLEMAEENRKVLIATLNQHAITPAQAIQMWSERKKALEAERDASMAKIDAENKAKKLKEGIDNAKQDLASAQDRVAIYKEQLDLFEQEHLQGHQGELDDASGAVKDDLKKKEKQLIKQYNDAIGAVLRAQKILAKLTEHVIKPPDSTGSGAE